MNLISREELKAKLDRGDGFKVECRRGKLGKKTEAFSKYVPDLDTEGVDIAAAVDITKKERAIAFT